MKIKSILDEIELGIAPKHKANVVESRANHVIISATNLVQTIRENYSLNEALLLERKLLNAIKTGKPEKFTNAIKRLEDAC